MADLEAALRSVLVRGGRAFVPYVTGGLAAVDADLLRGPRGGGGRCDRGRHPVLRSRDGRSGDPGGVAPRAPGRRHALERARDRQGGRAGGPRRRDDVREPRLACGPRGVPRRVRRRRRHGCDRARPPRGRGRATGRTACRGGVGRPGLPRGARHLGRRGCARSARRRGGSCTASRPTGSRARGTAWRRPPPSSSGACASSRRARSWLGWGSPSRRRPPRRARSPRARLAGAFQATIDTT